MKTFLEMKKLLNLKTKTISEHSFKKRFFMVIQTLREHSILLFWKHYGNVTVECSQNVLKQLVAF